MDIKKVIKLLVSLQIWLVFAIIINRTLIAFHIYNDNAINNSDFLLMLTIAVFAWGLFITQRYFYVHERHTGQQQMLDNIEKLNRELRSQRHDFLNHIQIIYSLIEMQEYSEASNYLNRVYGNIENINTFIKTQDTAINALLQAKANTCRDKGIEMKININSQLAELKIPSWEMCGALANVIDNGMYATLKYDGKKQIVISINQSLQLYEFRVMNKGEPLKDSLKQKIYSPGFTTNKSKGDGMGLYNVKRVITQYGGSVEVETGETSTTFILKAPRGK